ncbi:MAG TPA: HD domain-containing phosphohydrolase [Solirubrobacteraceae bacterium]|nr:HD domain-containing phosphohydrolase [Solirubrobacteraceae bacterium]
MLAGGGFVVLVLTIGSVRGSQSKATAAETIVADGDALLTSVLDLETGVRAFELTGDETFLDPWRAARSRLPRELRQLSRRGDAKPARQQTRQIQRIRRDIVDYLSSYSWPLVVAIRRGHHEREPTASTTAEGKRRVDALRRQLATLASAARVDADVAARQTDRAISRAMRIAGSALAVSLGLVLVLIISLAHRVAAPIRRVSQAAARLAAGDLSAHVAEHHSAREVSELASSFNVMADALRRTQDALGHQNDELSVMLDVRTHELDDARLEAFGTLVLAAGYRDDETRDHTRRVGEMAACLAQRVGMNSAMVEIIRQVAPLHDLGKIAVPDSILLKPGKLDDAEYATMKRHARTGAEILAGSESPLFQIAAEIAASHHERWDGSGYPDGIAGNEIPIAARIVGLVDAFDAITHQRPYKAARPLDEALIEIKRSSATHFDPDLVAAFGRLDHVALLDDPSDQQPAALSESTRQTLRRMRPSESLGFSAADERVILAAFRDTSRAILIADDDRRYVDANKAACRLLGVSLGELVGRRIDDFTPLEIKPHLDWAWAEFMRVGTQTTSVTLMRGDGAQVTTQLTGLAHFTTGLHLALMDPLNL